MSLNTVKRLGLECDIQKSNVHINGVHGNIIQSYGVLTKNVYTKVKLVTSHSKSLMLKKILIC